MGRLKMGKHKYKKCINCGHRIKYFQSLKGWLHVWFNIFKLEYTSRRCDYGDCDCSNPEPKKKIKKN